MLIPPASCTAPWSPPKLGSSFHGSLTSLCFAGHAWPVRLSRGLGQPISDHMMEIAELQPPCHSEDALLLLLSFFPGVLGGIGSDAYPLSIHPSVLNTVLTPDATTPPARIGVGHLSFIARAPAQRVVTMELKPLDTQPERAVEASLHSLQIDDVPFALCAERSCHCIDRWPLGTGAQPRALGTSSPRC